MKFYNVSRYRSVCIRHDFFTSGTNSQYEKAFELLRTGATLHDLTLVTWLCSSGYTYDEVQKILKDEM